jgi:DNA-binding transcriptional ArsR family regulator
LIRRSPGGRDASRGRIRSPHRSLPLSPSPARIRSTIAAVVDQPDDLRAVRLIHKTLADVNRLRIVRRLAQGEATVTELIDHVGLSQPLVSWHLGKLRLAGLVETRKAGRETVTRLIPEAWDRFATYERRVLGLEGEAARGSAAS